MVSRKIRVVVELENDRKMSSEKFKGEDKKNNSLTLSVYCLNNDKCVLWPLNPGWKAENDLNQK